MSTENSILIKNIYYMLAYAYKALYREGFEKTGTENFEHIHDLFAAILSRGIEYQLKQGLAKDYLKHNRTQKVLRGKVDINGTLKLLSRKERSLNCVYNVLTEDILLNRILKSAAILLLHNGDVTQENKNNLKRALLFFGNVREVNPFNINWSLLSYRKGNASYQMLVYLCRLLFDGLLINKNGRIELAEFLDSQHLCDLYEKFVLAYYQRHYPQFNPSAPSVAWNLDDGQDAFLPKMYTDIMLESNDKILIIDTKCYRSILSQQYDKKSVCSANLYQIYAYVKNKSAATDKVVSGMLLYAKTDEDITPDVAYSMGGNKIFVRTLDLNCEFKKIKEQLDKIVAENFTV